jgi:hypothetical protein
MCVRAQRRSRPGFRDRRREGSAQRERFQVFSVFSDVTAETLPYPNPQTQESVLRDPLQAVKTHEAQSYRSVTKRRARANAKIALNSAGAGRPSTWRRRGQALHDSGPPSGGRAVGLLCCARWRRAPLARTDSSPRVRCAEREARPKVRTRGALPSGRMPRPSTRPATAAGRTIRSTPVTWRQTRASSFGPTRIRRAAAVLGGDHRGGTAWPPALHISATRLRTRIKRRQRVLRLGGAVGDAVQRALLDRQLRGTSRLGRRRFAMLRTSRGVQVTRCARIKVRLTRRGARPLFRELRRPGASAYGPPSGPAVARGRCGGPCGSDVSPAYARRQRQYRGTLPTGSKQRASPWFELPSRNRICLTSRLNGPLYLST